MQFFDTSAISKVLNSIGKIRRLATLGLGNAMLVEEIVAEDHQAVEGTTMLVGPVHHGEI